MIQTIRWSNGLNKRSQIFFSGFFSYHFAIKVEPWTVQDNTVGVWTVKPNSAGV